MYRSNNVTYKLFIIKVNYIDFFSKIPKEKISIFYNIIYV